MARKAAPKTNKKTKKQKSSKTEGPTIKAMIGKKVVEHLKSQSVNCGECAGFSCEVIRDKKLCRDTGIIASSKPCTKFIPDTGSLRSVVEDDSTFVELSRLVAQFEDDKLRLLGAVLMREKLTRAAGYNMGMQVYVRFRGLARSNYLSNFMSAYIWYADTHMVRVTSRDGKICMTYNLSAAKDVIYTPDEFEPMRKQMRKKGRFVDPDVERMIAKHLRCLEEYELGITDTSDLADIPTIDRVAKTNKIRKGKKSGPNDLIAIVDQIESGYKVKNGDLDSERGQKGKVKGKRKTSGKVTQVDVSY